MARWKPPEQQVVQPPKPPRWPMIVLLLGLLGVAGAGVWMLFRRLHPAMRTDLLASATDVRSEVAAAGDSLDVVVSWHLTEEAASAMPDSVRLEVGLGDGRESRDHITSSDRSTDTLRLPAPPPGQTVAGYSCVAAVHGTRLSPESCTPWQYVRPAAPLPTAPESTAGKPRRKAAAAARGPRIMRIVVEPDGQQVDPDVGGRCAAWQRRNPNGRIWIDVNREAIPECTGPNGKPTIAQFCAFAVLEDGRRVKTKNSTNDLYCERLFQVWVRQRIT
jgi:hypothetical protein